MSRVAIIGVGQSTFVRKYPGSIRELAFEGFKEAIEAANPPELVEKFRKEIDLYASWLDQDMETVMNRFNG